MKFARASGLFGLATLAVVASPMASAGDDDFCWYVGANVGQSSATIDRDRIVSSLLAGGYTTASYVDDDSDIGYKLFGGYRFSEHFSLEGGYFNLGEFNYLATTVPAGSLSGNIKIQGVNLDLVGMLPIGERFSVFGRVGAIYAEAQDHFISTGAVNIITDRNPSKREANYKFGAGIQYDFSDALAMRLEGERYRINDAVGNTGDVDLFSLGLVYRFGAEAAPAAEPAPMAPQKTCADLDDDGDGVNNCDDKCPGSQAGQAIGPDGCPVPLTIDLKGVNFDFDKSTLRPDAVAILDEAISILGKYPQLRVEVAGHTDSIGTEEYNQGLSERRAHTVYDYLTGHGIDAGRLVGPTGYGESKPIAPNTNEDGSDNPEGRAKNRRTELNVQN